MLFFCYGVVFMLPFLYVVHGEVLLFAVGF